VRPGHEMGGLERVVEENGDYAIVQKLVAAAVGS
jgi:hypothetical protein